MKEIKVACKGARAVGDVREEVGNRNCKEGQDKSEGV